MADLRYRVDIDTKGAQNALAGLQRTILGIGASVAGAFAIQGLTQSASGIDDLRRTLGTLYKSVEAGNQVFDDLARLSNRLGVDINNLAQSAIKLKAAGIEPSAEQLSLFADVAALATDKVGALESITDLFTRTLQGGLGIEELDRLQDRGIPVLDILAEKLGKSRLEIAKFGQTARGAETIRAALSEGLSERFGGNAADRTNSLSSALTRLQNIFKGISDTLGQSGLNDAIVRVVNTLGEFIDRNKEVIQQIGTLLAAAINIVVNNIGTLTRSAIILFSVLAAKKIAEIAVAFAKLGKVIAKNPIGILAVGLAFAADQMGLLEPIINKVSEAFNRGADEAEKYLKSIRDSGDEVKKSEEPFKRLAEQTSEGTKANRNYKEEIKGLNEELAKFRVELDSTVGAFARQNQETIKSIQLETQLIGATRQQQEIQRRSAEITRNLTEEVARLREEKAKLTEAEVKEGRGQLIDATIAKLEAQAETDRRLTEEAIKNSEARKQAYALEQFQQQTRIQVEDKLKAIEKERAQLTLTNIEKKYDDIKRAADEAATAAIRAEEAQLGRKLNEAEAQRFRKIAIESTKQLTAETEKLVEQSRTFETGWKRAWRQYVEDARDASKTAEAVFTKATQGMEDAIVNFAKTGKFEFKSLLNTIVDELLRSQIRQLFANLFSTGSSANTGGNIFGNLGKILGFANGGIIPTNAPVVVGEKGPELLTNARGKRVIPNDQLGGSTQVVYNINAVDARSFKEMIARDPAFLFAVTEQGRRRLPGVA